MNSLKPYLIHNVYFWLKPNTAKEDKLFFEKGLEKLGQCPQIRQFYWGKPAGTEQRDVVVSSYDYSISVHFDSLELQADYQDEPMHHAFIKNHQHIWDKVVVYDTEVR